MFILSCVNVLNVKKWSNPLNYGWRKTPGGLLLEKREFLIPFHMKLHIKMFWKMHMFKKILCTIYCKCDVLYPRNLLCKTARPLKWRTFRFYRAVHFSVCCTFSHLCVGNWNLNLIFVEYIYHNNTKKLSNVYKMFNTCCFFSYTGDQKIWKWNIFNFERRYEPFALFKIDEIGSVISFGFSDQSKMVDLTSSLLNIK